MYGFISHENNSLKYLSTQPSDQREVSTWKEKCVKTESNIIICPCEFVLAKTSTTVDEDEKSAKEFWDVIKRKFTTRSQEEITRL